MEKLSSLNWRARSLGRQIFAQPKWRVTIFSQHVDYSPLYYVNMPQINIVLISTGGHVHFVTN